MTIDTSEGPYRVPLDATGVGAPQPPAQTLAPNFEGSWWTAPAGSESGWGLNFAHQGDVIFATVFTYDATGKTWWLSMTANRIGNNVFSGTLYETRGPAFNTVPFDSKCRRVSRGRHRHARLQRCEQRHVQLQRQRHRAEQAHHAHGFRKPADLHGFRDAIRSVRCDQLPGHLVGGGGHRRNRLGPPLHAPGRHHLRDLVHVRLRRLAAVAVGNRAEGRARRLQRNLVPDDRAGVRNPAIRPGARSYARRSATRRSRSATATTQPSPTA